LPNAVQDITTTAQKKEVLFVPLSGTLGCAKAHILHYFRASKLYFIIYSQTRLNGLLYKSPNTCQTHSRKFKHLLREKMVRLFHCLAFLGVRGHILHILKGLLSCTPPFLVKPGLVACFTGPLPHAKRIQEIRAFAQEKEVLVVFYIRHFRVCGGTHLCVKCCWFWPPLCGKQLQPSCYCTHIQVTSASVLT